VVSQVLEAFGATQALEEAGAVGGDLIIVGEGEGAPEIVYEPSGGNGAAADAQTTAAVNAASETGSV
jgi:hypothetical protein